MDAGFGYALARTAANWMLVLIVSCIVLGGLAVKGCDYVFDHYHVSVQKK